MRLKIESSLLTANRFLVTTPGLSATRWLCFALASRKNVFVSHGKHPLNSIIRGDLAREKGIGDLESFTLGNKMADFYKQKGLEEIFAAYQQVMPQARTYGNVHAFTIEALMKKIRSERELNGIKILNVLRHPVSYIESHYRLVRTAEAHPELYQHYEKAMLNQALEQYPELALLDDIQQTEFTAFVVSCLSVCNFANDFEIAQFQHVRMEDITTDIDALQKFCQYLTGMAYSRKDLEDIICQGPINCHRKNHSLNGNLNIYESWATWQQDIAQVMIPTGVLDKLEANGYDVSMLRMENKQVGTAFQEERRDSDEDTNVCVSTVGDSISKMFSKGNYTGVALANNKDCWQTYAAMGLIGKPREAIGGLERFQHEQARFYSAVGSWIDGDEKTAVDILEKVYTPHAQNLLALIRKPKIQILAQLPWARHGASDFLSYLHRDRKFNVRNISFHPQDLRNEPYADVFRFVDRKNPPDFFICKMVEWHLIPPNIQELSCPIISHTADYDLHIQGVYPWLQVFDEMVVTDHTEWEDARRLVDVPVATFPKSFGVPPELPQPPFKERPIDLFLSGSVTHPYHPDKARLLHESLRLPGDMNVWYIDGFTTPNIYYSILAQSKASFTFIRHSGAMPTRGLEALCMGCAVAVQKDSCLTLYVGEEEGVITYELEKGNLASALRRISRQWQEFEQRAKRGAEIIRSEFALPKVASQYLRFLTFLAARPRSQRRRISSDSLNQKRMIVSKGWLPGPPQVMQDIMEQNLACLVQTAQYEQGPTVVIDMARELVLQYAGVLAHRTRQPNYSPPGQDILTRAIAILHEGLSIFPKSLVLRFNLIRSALHYGRPGDVSQALQLARQTLALPADGWKINIDEDVFPWDFFSSFFNYRSYFDLITEHLTEGTDVGQHLARLIISSLHYYLGFYENGLENFQQAVRSDPDFPFYRFQLARTLIERGNPDDYEQAGKLLCGLADNSILFMEAYELLRQLKHRKLFKCPDYAELAMVFRRIKESDRLIKDTGIHIKNADWRQSNLQPALSTDKVKVTHAPDLASTRDESVGEPLRQDSVKRWPLVVSEDAENVTILIPTLNRSEFLLRALSYYGKVGFKGWICIGDSSNAQHSDRIKRVVYALEDKLNIIYKYFHKPPYINDSMCVNELIEIAPTPYLVYSGDDDLLVPSSLGQCAAFLKNHPEYSAAHGLRIAYKLKGGGEFGEIEHIHYVQQHIWESEKASKRWDGYVRNATSTQYYVHRKETWQRMYRDIGSVPTRYFGPEFLPCSLTAILGKVKQLECLATLFQMQDNRPFSWDKTSLYDLTVQQDWSKSVQGLRRSIVEALMQQDGVNEKIAQETFDKEFWHHLKSFFVWQYQKKYGDLKSGEISVSFNLAESFESIYAMIINPKWSNSIRAMRDNGIKAIVQNYGIDLEKASGVFDRELWFCFLVYLNKQYQEKYGVEQLNNQADRDKNISCNYGKLLSLKILLNRESPFYKDFIPAYQVVTGQVWE